MAQPRSSSLAAPASLAGSLDGLPSSDASHMLMGRERINNLLAGSQGHALDYDDIAPFLKKDYDPQEYANTIIEGPKASTSRETLNGWHGAESDTSLQPSLGAEHAHRGSNGVSWLPTSGHVEGDLSVALGRMNLAIDDVDRMIRDQVMSNAGSLLAHTTTLMDQRPVLAALVASLSSLEDHQAKLVARVSEPRRALQAQSQRMARLREAHALVKESQIVVRLFRRLDTQMQALSPTVKPTLSADDKTRLQRLGEEDAENDAADHPIVAGAIDDGLDNEDEQVGRGLSRAASTITQITNMLSSTQAQSLSSASEAEPQVEDRGSALMQLPVVQELLPSLDESRDRVSNTMEDMVVRGLRDLSPTMLSISLQTAYNLGQLTDLVRDLVNDLNDVVRDRVRNAFDMQAMARELGTREPLGPQQPSYRARKVEQAAGHQKQWNAALWKRLEMLLSSEMGAICSKVYTLQKVLSLKSDASTGEKYLDMTVALLGNKPSSNFWSTLADAIEAQCRRATSTFLLQSLEAGYPRLLHLLRDFFTKVSMYTDITYAQTQEASETVTVYRAIARFESAYLARVRARFDSIVAPWSPRVVPDTKEATRLSRAILDELDAARREPHLWNAVGKIAFDWLEKATWRIDDLIDTDTTPFPAIDTPQLQNASLANATYTLHRELGLAESQCPAELQARARSLVQSLDNLYREKLVEPLVDGAICKELSDIIAKMHYVDFGLDRDAVGGSGSAYMADLSERTWFIREQLLVHYTAMPTRPWLLRIAKHALRLFVLHASLLRPLKEGGKLKLTTDMTELEFSIAQLLSSARSDKTGERAPTMADCGQDFAALRCFRSMLFKDIDKSKPRDILHDGLPPIVAVHYVIGSSHGIPLPYVTRKQNAADYVRWLLRAGSGDLWTLADEKGQALAASLEAWRAERKAKSPGPDAERDARLASLAEEILKEASSSQY